MKQLAFCEYCHSENEYDVYNMNKTAILKDETINYIAKEASCSICRNEIFVSEICDYNLNILYNEYRKKHNLICGEDIKNILIKYSVDHECLSLLLGYKRETINRYLEGDIPLNSHSDVLKKIFENPNYYSLVLQTNKERINPISYNISRQAVKSILNNKVTEEKIDAVIKHILVRGEDFTLIALQNLLYYVQGFHYVFTQKFIFEEDCEACINGPAFNSVFKRYEKYGYDEVNKWILANRNLELEDVEISIVESVIKFYGCYSGKILKQMTHNEAPWILTRTKINKKNDLNNEEINKIIDKELILQYFSGIKMKYTMTNLLDIQKYSIDLFNKISM